MKQFKLKILPTGGWDYSQTIVVNSKYCFIFNGAYIFTNTDAFSARLKDMHDISNIVCSYPVKNTIIEEVEDVV